MSTQKNIGASVRARLLNRAKDSGSDYGMILTKYALERILYRLSVSQWHDAFLLKGARLWPPRQYGRFFPDSYRSRLVCSSTRLGHQFSSRAPDDLFILALAASSAQP
jgi:hypothetical protein